MKAFYEFFGYTYIILFFDKIKYSQHEHTTMKNTKVHDNDWNIYCKIQPNGFNCDDKGLTPPRFYYDIKLEDCITFNFGQCKNIHLNNFPTREECHEKCREPGIHSVTQNISAKVLCRLQPAFGECNSYHPMWYFDVTERLCKGFSYSGCGGNLNRFSTSQLCTTACASTIVY